MCCPVWLRLLQPDLVFVNDLGLDAVFLYRVNASAGDTLTEVARFAMPPGSGPRHLAFHPNGTIAYVLGELGNTLTVCRLDGESLSVLASVSTLPDVYDASAGHFGGVWRAPLGVGLHFRWATAVCGTRGLHRPRVHQAVTTACSVCVCVCVVTVWR